MLAHLKSITTPLDMYYQYLNFIDEETKEEQRGSDLLKLTKLVNETGYESRLTNTQPSRSLHGEKRSLKTIYLYEIEVNFLITCSVFLGLPYMKASLTINQPISWSQRSVVRSLWSKTSVDIKSGLQNGFLCSPETAQHYHGNFICNSQNYKYLKLDWTSEKYWDLQDQMAMKRKVQDLASRYLMGN